MKPVLFGLTEATLIDVDLPFLRLLPVRPLVDAVQAVEVDIGGQCYQIRVAPFGEVSNGVVWVRLLEQGLSGEVLEHRFLQERLRSKESERRNDSRLKTTLSVRSPDLPNLRGTTYDVSDCGLRLVTEEPVAVGSFLRLEVGENAEAVCIHGEALWTAPRVNSLHHVGVRLISHG